MINMNIVNIMNLMNIIKIINIVNTINLMNHTASSAPGYGTQPLHWHQMQKDSEGEKSAKKGLKIV